MRSVKLGTAVMINMMQRILMIMDEMQRENKQKKIYRGDKGESKTYDRNAKEHIGRIRSK